MPELAAEIARNPHELATMGWDELRELAERGVDVASHTVSHPHLTRLSDDELDDELSRSRERLEDELGRRCRFIAYPYGESDSRVRAAARAAGYEAGFGLPGDARSADGFDLPRVGVWRGGGMIRMTLKTSRIAQQRVRALTRSDV